jgi:hypothetical protein
MFSFEHMLKEPEMEILWLCLVWYPETKVKASPDALAISPLAFSEKVVGSALKMGNTNWFELSTSCATPLNAIGFSLCEKIPFDVVVKGWKKFLEYTVLIWDPEPLVAS